MQAIRRLRGTDQRVWRVGLQVRGATGCAARPGCRPGERVPKIVMLHGCGQDAKEFAASTRMNQVAARERFIVLYLT